MTSACLSGLPAKTARSRCRWSVSGGRACGTLREYHRLVDGASERLVGARDSSALRVSAAVAAQIVLQPVVRPPTGGHAQLVAGRSRSGRQLVKVFSHLGALEQMMCARTTGIELRSSKKMWSMPLCGYCGLFSLSINYFRGGVCHSLVPRPWYRWFILNKLLSQNQTQGCYSRYRMLVGERIVPHSQDSATCRLFLRGGLVCPLVSLVNPALVHLVHWRQGLRRVAVVDAADRGLALARPD